VTKPHERARAWREKRGLTLDQLSELTGYSVSALRQLEAGKRFGGARHSEWVVERYRMACAGAEAQIKSGRRFEW
jgi:transcriptional regulator with XRE-family HTH domain